MVGSPVAHSMSPVLHLSAYRELGLTGWTYDRIDVGERELPEFVAGLGPEWAGLGVTMPGKRAAYELATERTDRAVAVGAANTLVALGFGAWLADCTDVEGVTGALLAAGGYRPVAGAIGVVLGAGGTAAAALAGLAELDVTDVVLVVREPGRAAAVLAAAERIGTHVTVSRWAGTDLRALVTEAAVVVSTVPGGAVDPFVEDIAHARCLLDVIYHPWPTPLAEAVARHGGRLATGLDMLLHQAFSQVEQIAGKPAPREVMRDALRAATGNVLPLPLA